MSGGALAVFILVAGAILIFNFIAQRSKRLEQRMREHAKAHVPQPPEPAQEEIAWGRPQQPQPPLEVIPPRPVARKVATAPAPVLAPPRARPRSALFRTRNDLRHAVVVMTVLGPCRALQPYDFGQAGGASGVSRRSRGTS